MARFLGAPFRLSSRDRSCLEDIRVWGRRALDLTARVDEEAFVVDDAIPLAVLHCLMLVGEAANQVSPAMQLALAGVPWTKVIGLRHVIVHHYRKVDLGQIWTIVQRDLPRVVEAVEGHLSSME